MSDVVSQLEAVLVQIEMRTPHLPTCGNIVGRANAEGMYIDHVCDCAKSTRVRTEIARVWIASIEAGANEAFGMGHGSAACGAYLVTVGEKDNDYRCPRCLVIRAAFRATQEQETPK